MDTPSAELPIIAARKPWHYTPHQVILWETFRERWGQPGYETVENHCLCGFNQRRRLVASEDRYGMPVSTYLCLNCGLIYTTPRLTDSALQAFYEHEYRELYFDAKQPAEKFFETQAGHGSSALRRIEPHLAHHSEPKRVVDFGCGAGGSLMPFRQQGMTTIGFDFDSDYLAFGRKHGLDLIDLSGTDPLEYLDHNGGLADVAIAQHVLEHCADPITQLKLWTSCLRDGGLLYIEVPGVFNAYREYSSFTHFLHIAHLFHFNLSTLSNVVLSATGFGLLDGDESIYAVFRKGANPSVAKRVEGFLDSRESGLGQIAIAADRFFHRIGRSVSKRLPRNRKP